MWLMFDGALIEREHFNFGKNTFERSLWGNHLREGQQRRNVLHQHRYSH